MSNTDTELNETINGYYKKLNDKFYSEWMDIDQCFHTVQEMVSYLTCNHIDPSDPEDPHFETVLFTKIRDCFEIGVIVSLRIDNVTVYQYLTNQLLMIYENKEGLPPSSRFSLIFSLYLFYLLSEEKFREFNCAVASLDVDLAETDVFLLYATDLHALICTGNYARVFDYMKNLPNEGFACFIEPIFNNARRHLCKIVNRSYVELSLKAFAELLYLPSVDDAMHIVKQKKWNVTKKGVIRFRSVPSKENFEYLKYTTKYVNASTYSTEKFERPTLLLYPNDVIKEENDFEVDFAGDANAVISTAGTMSAATGTVTTGSNKKSKFLFQDENAAFGHFFNYIEHGFKIMHNYDEFV